MGFACCGPAANMTVARPLAISFASNPIRRATGTSLTLARSTFRFPRTYLGFEVLLEMIAGEIEWPFVSLQTSHHEAAFERTGNQCSQFQGIDVRADLASASPLLRNQLQTIKPRAEGPPGFRSQLRIAIVGIYGGVQQRAPSRHQPIPSVPEVPHDLFQAVNRIRDLLCSFEARLHRDFPSVVEGIARELLFALKVTVYPALLQSGRSHEIG